MANENTRQSFVVKHINSNQLVNGAPKLPTADQIEYGEIAINYAQGHETISIKNSANEIVPLYISEVGTGKVGENYQQTEYPEPFNDKVSESKVSANDPYDTAFKKTEQTISILTQEVLDNESVTAEGIAQLGAAAGIIREDYSIGYVVESGSNYIKNATSVHDATVILDSKLKEVEGQISEGGKVNDVKVNGASVLNQTTKVADISLTTETVKNGDKTLKETLTNLETQISGAGKVDDVKVNGTSVLDQATKVANISIDGGKIDVASSYTSVVYDAPFEEKAQHIQATDKVSEAFGKIENTIKAFVTEVLNDENVTSQSVSALAQASGTVDEDGKIVYIKKANPKFIGSAESVSEAVDILDDKVNDIITSIIKNKIQSAFDAFVAANPGLNNITV